MPRAWERGAYVITSFVENRLVFNTQQCCVFALKPIILKDFGYSYSHFLKQNGKNAWLIYFVKGKH